MVAIPVPVRNKGNRLGRAKRNKERRAGAMPGHLARQSSECIVHRGSNHLV